MVKYVDVLGPTKIVNSFRGDPINYLFKMSVNDLVSERVSVTF